MRTLVVVDGHNLVNDVGRFLVDCPLPDVQEVRSYLENWFDLDRLVEATTGEGLDPWDDLGIVLFHSRKSFGKQPYHFNGDSEARRFWARQGSNPHTSALLVDVDGSRKGKDAGVDTAIVVYMFETMDRWDSVVLFTNDADFVPAVWSLRRQGKRVFCASDARNKASPLVQSCQHFFAWHPGYLTMDYALFRLLAPDGPLDQFLRKPEVARQGPVVRAANGALTIGHVSDGNARNALDALVRPLGFSCDGTRVQSGVLPVRPNRETGGPTEAQLVAGLLRHWNHPTFGTAEWRTRWVR